MQTVKLAMDVTEKLGFSVERIKVILHALKEKCELHNARRVELWFHPVGAAIPTELLFTLTREQVCSSAIDDVECVECIFRDAVAKCHEHPREPCPFGARGAL